MGDKQSKDDMKKAASAFSRLGAAKGGRARASILTREQRTEAARRAAHARWGKGNVPGEPKAIIAEAPEKPAISGELPYSMFRGTLQFGGLEIECHVLNDLRRVFTQREVVRILSGGRESGNLPRYLDRLPLQNKDLELGPTIQFKVPGSAQIANGSEATDLVSICEAYLDARDANALKASQLGLAKQAEIVIRASAKIGIIALVDEATGYEKVKEKRALQLKFQAFIADEMQEWAVMFPEEFWFELARLEGIRYSPRSRPLRWGRYIMMFVYDAVDADVGKQLRAKNPNPRFLKNHHQWLKKFGRDKVHDQIMKVTAIMKTCDDMDQFRKRFAKAFSKSPVQLDFDDALRV